MAVLTRDTPSRIGREPAEGGRLRPVNVWACIGVVFLTVEAIALIGWFTSGDATRTPTGPTPVPTYMKVFIHGSEVVSIVALAVFLYYVLYRPWRRDGRISVDGLFCLVFLTIFWQDTFNNFFQHWFTYNAEFVNLGAWYPHVPGWYSPNANLTPTPLLLYTAYVWGIFGVAMTGNVVMRKAKARWPQLGTRGLIGVCFAFFIVVEGIVEPLMVLSGIAAYPGGIPWLTLFHGKYYQFPLTEWFLWSVAWTAWSCLRYFRDDKGRTVVERGVDEIQANPRRNTLRRFFALAGACNAIYLVLFNIPAAIVGLYSGPWPEDITKRSYLTDGYCGPGTEYACPGPGIPVPRPDSLHLDPQGRLVR